jgi:hypothetical protein
MKKNLLPTRERRRAAGCPAAHTLPFTIERALFCVAGNALMEGRVMLWACSRDLEGGDGGAMKKGGDVK